MEALICKWQRQWQRQYNKCQHRYINGNVVTCILLQMASHTCLLARTLNADSQWWEITAPRVAPFTDIV